MCGCLSCAPHWWPSSKLRHVPRLGIEPATPQFTGLHSVHQATPARADLIFLYNQLQLLTSPWHQGIKCIIVLIFLNLMSSVLRPHPSTWQEIKSQLLFKPPSSTESCENPRLTLSQELWEGAIFSPWMDVDFIPIHASPWSGCYWCYWDGQDWWMEQTFVWCIPECTWRNYQHPSRVLYMNRVQVAAIPRTRSYFQSASRPQFGLGSPQRVIRTFMQVVHLVVLGHRGEVSGRVRQGRRKNQSEGMWSWSTLWEAGL